jgi:hypothetical protein
MFVPTLRINSLAHKIPRNSTNLNRVYLNKFKFDTNGNGYCTRVINTPTDKTYHNRSVIQIPIIRSTGGESLLSQSYIDLKNNLSSDSMKYTNGSNRCELFQAPEGSTSLSNVEDTTNKSNLTSLNDTDSLKIDKSLGRKRKSEHPRKMMTDIYTINGTGTKLINLCLMVSTPVLLMVCVASFVTLGFVLFFSIADFILEHPEFALCVVLFCLFLIV